MSKQGLGTVAVGWGLAALLSGCQFEQPQAGCVVQDATFRTWYAKYELKEGHTVPPACEGVLLRGEPLGVFKFTDPYEPGSAILTLRPQGLYGRASRDPGEEPFAQTAVAKLADEPGGDNFCTTEAWAAASVNAEAGSFVAPGAVESQEETATQITYEYDQVRVYSAPDAPGTQLTGELTYTRDGCSAQYTFQAIWPAVPCNPASPNPSEKCGAGSSINPQFAVVCDTSVQLFPEYPGVCVAQKPIPSFKEGR
ncbi:MAG TPA: hypothetical protein VF815_08550 [Myxococcaceae bacterium]|jgi:hypothetical protein